MGTEVADGSSGSGVEEDSIRLLSGRVEHARAREIIVEDDEADAA